MSVQTTVNVGMWLLAIVTTFVLYWRMFIFPLNKKIKELEKNALTLKSENEKMFEVIIQAFEFLSEERKVIIKDLDEVKRRIRIYSNESKKQTITRKAYNQNKRII